MIQRIQSLFLLMASLFFFGEFIFPFFKSSATKTGFFTDSVYTIQDHPALLSITIAGGVLCLLTIFLFNNRPLQQKLVYVGLVLSVALFGAAIALGMSDTPDLFSAASIFIGSFLPIGALLMLALSLRGISKDDKLVKSMDRLR